GLFPVRHAFTASLPHGDRLGAFGPPEIGRARTRQRIALARIFARLQPVAGSRLQAPKRVLPPVLAPGLPLDLCLPANPASAARPGVLLLRFGLPAAGDISTAHRHVGKGPHDGRVEIGVRFLDQARAELFAEGPAPDLLYCAAWQGAELKRPVGDTDQPRHLEAEGGQDVPDLAVLALAQPDGEPGIRPLLTVERGLDRTVIDSADGHAFLQPF